MATEQVTLKNAEGAERQFDVPHALRILQQDVAKGKSTWTLSDKGFKFKNNEIIRTGNNHKDSKTEEGTGN